MTHDRQLYPDFLRATAIGKIIVFHFFGWQLLTYIPSLGIMFALAGWFAAVSFSDRSAPVVIYQRFIRLLPTWWAFALFTLIGGFFYSVGSHTPLNITFAWIFPYQMATWSLDNNYANDAVVVTWYIAAYLWLLMLSPLLLLIYKKLSWLAILICIIVMVVWTEYYPHQDTIFGSAMYDVLTFSGCWMLGFAKADGALDKVPRCVVWMVTAVCCTVGFLLTWQAQALSSNPIALCVMSFGIAALLLSFNPNLSFLPLWVKTTIRTINTYAVTIYLFHNILVDVAYKLGEYIKVYDVGNYVGLENHTGQLGNWLCFALLLPLIYAVVKTIGIVETHQWIQFKRV